MVKKKGDTKGGSGKQEREIGSSKQEKEGVVNN